MFRKYKNVVEVLKSGHSGGDQQHEHHPGTDWTCRTPGPLQNQNQNLQGIQTQEVLV